MNGTFDGNFDALREKLAKDKVLEEIIDVIARVDASAGEEERPLRMPYSSMPKLATRHWG